MKTEEIERLNSPSEKAMKDIAALNEFIGLKRFHLILLRNLHNKPLIFKGRVMKFTISVLLLVMSLNVHAVPEIPDPNLNDIAIATHMNGQVVIIYNPNYCNQLGPFVCNFFRAHEYGHVNLEHVLMGTHPVQAEYEADCWAARNAPPQQVQAAYYHFMNQGFMGDWSHGTGIQRGQRVAACAGYSLN